MTTFQKKIILPILGLAVTLLGIQLFVTMPLQRSVTQRANELSQERVKAAVAEDQQKTALLTKTEFAQVEPIGKELTTYFVDQNRILDFITLLETAAQKADVQQTIQDLKPPAAEKQSSLQLTARGSFESLQRYLVALERLPYYVNIASVHFARESAKENISATIQATIFWL